MLNYFLSVVLVVHCIACVVLAGNASMVKIKKCKSILLCVLSSNISSRMAGNTRETGNVPVLNPAVISREGLSGGIVLVNCDTGTALSLNSTGTLVWGLIDGNRGPAEILESVLGHFQDPPDTVGEDIRSLLAVLAEEGFIGYEMNAGKP